jgi:hypothetical protein
MATRPGGAGSATSDGVYDPVEEGSTGSFSVLVGSRDDAESIALAFRGVAELCLPPDPMRL